MRSRRATCGVRSGSRIGFCSGLLDEQGAIKFAGWKTNSHYLGECARSHPWYAIFAELSDLYERAIYARLLPPADAAEALLVRVNHLCETDSVP